MPRGTRGSNRFLMARRIFWRNGKHFLLVTVPQIFYYILRYAKRLPLKDIHFQIVFSRKLNSSDRKFDKSFSGLKFSSLCSSHYLPVDTFKQFFSFNCLISPFSITLKFTGSARSVDAIIRLDSIQPQEVVMSHTHTHTHSLT